MPQQQRTFDTFIFDLDGTLLNTLPDLVVVTNAALEQMGMPPRTRDEVLSYVGNGVKALMYQAVPAGTPAEIADEALEKWKAFNLSYENNLTAPYPSVPETLRALRARGCATSVLSNKFDAGVQLILNKCLPGLFDVAHGESENFPRKPNPAGLLRTMAELNAEPKRTAYIGDSPGDIETARRAGAFAIGVSWGYHAARELREAGADLIIESMEELAAFVK